MYGMNGLHMPNFNNLENLIDQPVIWQLHQLIQKSQLAPATILYGMSDRVCDPAIMSLVSALFGKKIIDKNNSLDFLEIASEGTIKIEHIKLARDFMLATPYQAKMRVVWIRCVENMTLFACNALLKILEEPPQNRYWLLTTESFARIPATITSRCQCWHYLQRIASYDVMCVSLGGVSEDSQKPSNAHVIQSQRASRPVVQNMHQRSPPLDPIAYPLIQIILANLEQPDRISAYLMALNKKDEPVLLTALQYLMLDLLKLKHAVVDNLACLSNLDHRFELKQLQALADRISHKVLFALYEKLLDQKRYQRARLDVILLELKRTIET